MKNIFEGAKFGDKFLTRDGRVAIYWRKETNDKWHVLIVGDDNIGLYVEETGLAVGNHTITPEWDDDIVSNYKEPIDEQKLDELAEEYYDSEIYQPSQAVFENGKLIKCADVDDNGQPYLSEFSVIQAYKAGYKKAKE